MPGEWNKGRQRAKDPQMIATTEHSISMSLPNIWQLELNKETYFLSNVEVLSNRKLTLRLNIYHKWCKQSAFKSTERKQKQVSITLWNTVKGIAMK